MGTKGNRSRRQKAGTEEGKPRAINPTWTDCTPAFRLEAEGVLRLRDEFLRADDAAHRDMTGDRLRRHGEDLARKYPQSPLAHHVAGESRLALGKPKQALPYFTNASALQPKCLEIAHSVAAAHAELEHFGLAAEECRRALAVEDPTDPLLHTVAGAPPPPPETNQSNSPKVRIAIARERLRMLLADVTKLPCRVDVSRELWKEMNEDQRRSFLRINVDDMLSYFRTNQQGSDQQHVLESALDFVNSTQAWGYWVCPCCKNIYVDSQIFWSHIKEKNVIGLQEFLVNSPKQESDMEAELLVISDVNKHITLDQGYIVLSFDDDKLVPNGEDGSFNSLLSLLRQPMREISWTSLSQDCPTKGADIIAKLQKIMPSQKAFTEKESLDVASVVHQLKTDLVKACRFDYHSVIKHTLQVYLTAKLNVMVAEEEKSKHSLDEQLKQDNVPLPIPEKVQSHGEASRPPSQTSRDTYAGVLNKDKENDALLEEEFLNFLKKYKRDDTEEPFYVGELKAMISRNGKTFCVYYSDVTSHSENLTNSLRRLYVRIQPYLQRALKKFIEEEKMVAECVKISPRPPKLFIHGLPLPLSQQSLADFLSVSRHKLVETVQIYGNVSEVAVVSTQLGRDLFLGFLCYVLKKHREGKSWNGDFSIDDLQVLDGSLFEIAKQTTAQASRESMAADIKKLAALLMRYYQISGCCSAYFTQLESDMNECFKSLGRYNSAVTVRFHKYLKSSLALKSEMARGHLFLDLYRVRQALCWDDFKNLQNVLTAHEWTNKTQKNVVLKEMCQKGIDEDDTKAENKTKNTSA